MRHIGLEFLPNPGGEAEGLSDAGIETFRDKPFAAVARETGQNSRDARQDNSLPVRITFDVIQVNALEFPSIASFRAAAARCLAKAQNIGNEKDIGFFGQAIKALSADRIRILRISDFNTKGVRGPCEEGRPFHTLAKTDGVSTKENLDAGGSFGIGKNAVFALSDIQTAFFSTRYTDDEGEDRVLCIGKTLFISHAGEDGFEKRRKGYWGLSKGYMPLDDDSDIPAWLRRSSQGTSIYSICMRANLTDWRYEMTAAILINFFGAIERNEMEFEIDSGSIKINRNTIQSLFANAHVNKSVDELNSRTRFEAAKTLHACIIDEKTITRSLNVKDLGSVLLRVLLRDGLGYTIGIVRNGMYITDNLANFNEPFKRFPLHRDFAVVVEPGGTQEGEWFKRLENPRHDDLSAERITDPGLRAQGQRAFERLAKQIRLAIKELAKSEPSSSLELDELNDFFASDEAHLDDDDGPERDPRSFKPTAIAATPVKPPKQIYQPGMEEEDVLGPEPPPGPNQDSEPNPNPEPGPHPRHGKAVDQILLQNERNRLTEASDPRKRRLFFTSPVAGEIGVSVAATGLSTPESLVVTGISRGRVEKGSLILTCELNERVSVDIEFNQPYGGPIELSAYQVREIGNGVAA